MPPADDEVAASTTSGSMTGSDRPPANTEVAATDKAAASTNKKLEFHYSGMNGQMKKSLNGIA